MTRAFNIWTLAHPRTLLIIAFLVPLVAFSYFFYDRVPPTVQTGPSAPAAGKVGEEITILVPIDRDITRGCSVVVVRTIVDASLQSTVLVPRQEIGPQGLRMRDLIDENFFHVRFTIPLGLPSGKAHLLTDSSWVCAKNPTTWVMPIQSTWDWPFTILPPVPIVTRQGMPKGTPGDPVSVTIEPHTAPAASGAKP